MNRSDVCGVRRKRCLQCLVVATILMTLVAGGAAEASTPFEYDAKGRRDPFSPLVRDGVIIGQKLGLDINPDVPVLYGILFDPGGNSIAIVNDEEVQTGETIVGYRVAEIREDVVVLERGGELVVLRITFETPTASAP